ncbi:hypothetical protein DSO57_1024144 [Entomophthora muscae]|uniref:Uncharacterized protein n=1 Tax=Entomophthora muscae TaxID=34485 RepID=A0ACC2UCB9_9FUNG|nr:hypothetical protein DSO57_1024144 [Entomophthora muscae]
MMYERKATTPLLLGGLIFSDKAMNSYALIKYLVNHIINIQANAYTSVYKTKTLELSSDITRCSPLPEFKVGDHFLYYQHRVRGHAHKLDTLWVEPLEISGLTIVPLWKPRPGSRNQTLTLDSFGLSGLWTAGLPTCVFL